MLKFRALAYCCSLIAIAACSKHEPTTQADEPVPQPVKDSRSEPEIDACSLISAEEMAEIAGQRVQETKHNRLAEQGLAVAQCFYQLAASTDSVSVRVVQRAGGAEGREPRNVWTETFAPEKLKEAGARAPEPVPNLGDAAFWRSRRKGGALYVLRGPIYLRIGYDGPEEREAKIEKSAEVARRVLSRL